MRLVTVCLLAVLLASGAARGETGGDLPTAQAVEYRTIETSDLSFPGRKRMRAAILAPAASTVEQRAQTALKAAVDLQERTGADAVKVVLEISPALAGQRLMLAIGEYAPDLRGWTGFGPHLNGSWQASATAETIPERAVEIATLWLESEGKFQKDDGSGGTTTDGAALNDYVAETMDIEPDAVRQALLDLSKIMTTRRAYSP